MTTTTDGYPAAGAARPHAISTSQVTGSPGTTSYGYDASGHLATITATAQNETLTWNDAGQLTQAAITPAGGSAHNTNYIYDADGTLLLTADPGTTTLYLPDEELSLNTGTGTVTGTRYYAIGGATVAARTGASGLAYLAGDAQGTDSVAIDSGTLSVNRRYYDPYGNARGSAPSSFPVGEKGFVGGANDTATGLTDLGAREYQPGTGSFISPDPQLHLYDPLNLNAYAYAADNPSTKSDPSGAYYAPQPGANGGGCDVQSGCHPGHTDPKPKGYSPPPTGTRDRPDRGNARICDPGHGCASRQYWRHHPVHDEPAPPVHKTPPAHPVTNGRNTNSCPMRVMQTQIGFMLGGCAGEGVTTGINLSEPDDERGKTGSETGETGDQGGLTPGQGTTAAEQQGEGEPASTPEGRPYSWHYLNETGPVRNLPGSVIDETIDHPTEVDNLGDRTVYYDAKNDVTVVQSNTTGKIMSARRGKP